MKKLLFLLLFATTLMFGQIPQGISHRGTAYNPDGSLVISSYIKIKIEILNYTTAVGSGGGTPIYQETFNPKTNALGQYNLNIGTGTPIAPFDDTSFGLINWGDGLLKYLQVFIDPLNSQTPNYTVIGGNQLLSVPYALFSQTSQNSNSSTKSYNTINDLRTVTGTIGEIVYIKGHTSTGDGGQGNFIWKNIPQSDARFDDNNGTLIRTSATTGAWFRLIDGRINIKYFGVIGFNPSDGIKIQNAIDFAAKNCNEVNPQGGNYFINYSNAGTVVYIPAGNYKIENTLILKSGVSIEGESIQSTILTALNTQPNGNMIEMDSGKITGIHISEITFNGGDINDFTTKNCFHLKAQIGTGDHGGLENSTFKNLRINGFNGCGIILEGGGGANYDYKLPNQDLVFENVNIKRLKDNANCLLIQGQNGQISFINCGFDGKMNWNDLNAGNNFSTSKFFNVVLESKGHIAPSIIDFKTCTFQYSEYGVFLRYAENVTFDNCWFEMLDRAIGIVKSTDTATAIPSKSINVLNSRFANASGYGSSHDKVNNVNSPPSGSCIYIEGSQVNIENNFVTVSDKYNTDNVFIRNYGLDSDINSMNNSYKNDDSGKPISDLGKTFGVANKTITLTNSTLETSSYKFVRVNTFASNITEIKSNIGAGETITIKANGNGLIFDNTKNIILTKTGVLNLNYGETVTFMKVDGTYVNAGSTYIESWQQIAISTNDDSGWINVSSFSNSCTSYDANSTVRFRKKNGIVILDGNIKGGATVANWINGTMYNPANLLFTLPSGYRPTKATSLQIIRAGNAVSGVPTTTVVGRIDIDMDGKVYGVNYSTVWNSLSGIQFFVD